MEGILSSVTVDVVSLVVAILLGSLTVKEFIDHRRELQEKRLKLTMSSLSNERSSFSDKALEIHGGGDHYVLAKEEWLLPFEKAEPFRDVSAVLVEDAPHRYTRPRFTKLPYLKSTYSDNVKLTSGKYIFPSVIYALAGEPFRDGGGLRVPVKLGSYTDFYDTCDYMSYEIAYRLRIQNKPYATLGLDDLPYRKRIEPYDFSNRFAGIGICTLTIVKNTPGTDEVFFLVHKRSGVMAEGGNTFHVVPAGSYQPIIREKDYAGDVFSPLAHGNTLCDSAMREFVEEVATDDCERLASISLLDRYTESVYADALYFGIGLEPLNLKTEMLGCIIIDFEKSELFRGYSDIREFVSRRSSVMEGEISVVPFDREHIEQYMFNESSLPAFREILWIVYKSYDACLDHQVVNNIALTPRSGPVGSARGSTRGPQCRR